MIHSLFKNFMNQEIQGKIQCKLTACPRDASDHEDPMGSRRHDTHSDDGSDNGDQC